MNKKIILRPKTALGSKLKLKGDRKYDEKIVQKALKKHGLKEEEKLTIVNTFTNKVTDVQISRIGTTGMKLVDILQDPKATEQQRDAVLSAYLFERGKENASFIAELFVSKGTHTRETQHFKKQMRFDYEMFADAFIHFLDDTAKDVKGKTPEELPELLSGRFERFATMLSQRIQKITEDRMRNNGYGIYIDKEGKVYDTRTEEILDVVDRDVKSEQQNHE